MIITGKAYWAKLFRPGKSYDGDPEWSIDVTVDADSRRALEEAGLGAKIKPPTNNKGREHEGKEEYIQFSKPTHSKNGVELYPIEVVNGKNKEFPSDVMIGNGSLVRVMLTPHPWEMNGRSGFTPRIQKVQVVDLVEVEPREEFPVDADEDSTSSSEEAW